MVPLDHLISLVFEKLYKLPPSKTYFVLSDFNFTIESDMPQNDQPSRFMEFGRFKAISDVQPEKAA